MNESASVPNPTRRDLLKGAGALGALSLLGFPLRALAQGGSGPGLVFPLVLGPYQENGASPWYAEVPLGTPGQTLKFGMDTGGNFIWVTSSLCDKTGCVHYGNGEFIYQKSGSFAWVDQKPQTVDFGPWGSMVVQTGKDDFGVAPGKTSSTTLYLSQKYSCTEFAQLDWDGGIALPSGTRYAQPGLSFFVGDLMNAGLIDPTRPYISFETDLATKKGSCRIGGFDPDAFDPNAGIRMPWKEYTQYPGVGYIWSTPLQKYAVGGKTVAENVLFCLDSGSSQFKGDNRIMLDTLDLIRTLPSPPDVAITVGESTAGGPGEIVVPPSVYEVLIQAGPQQGKVLPEFQPLGLENLVLVGSVVLDLFYTIYEYEVTGSPGQYVLEPVAFWVFNKAGGPPLLKRGGKPANLGGRR
jgi:hypothetical protein